MRSIVGRFLEHSRLYAFEAGDRSSMYIGSPDLMQRNLDHRIEVLVPVENGRIRQDVHALLDSALADDTNAWILGSDGAWTRAIAAGGKPHSHHAAMMRRAQATRSAPDTRAPWRLASRRTRPAQVKRTFTGRAPTGSEAV